MWHPVATANRLEQQLIDLAHQQGGVFHDEEFPASKESIMGPLSTPQSGVQDPFDINAVQWKRPIEMTPHPAMFVDGASAGDIIQGNLGDCWFLGALATVANRPDLLGALIVAQHLDLGFIIFQFYKDGEWRLVYIDDRLPCFDGMPLFASSQDLNELWVPLMEKAYAKLHGGYNGLNTGSIAFAFADLTGGVCECPDLLLSNDEWPLIQRALAEDWLLGVSAIPSQTLLEENIRAMGILPHHAYSIIFAQEIASPPERLIQLRNPWGNTEWTGAWSDNSPQWTKEVMSQLQNPVHFGDDGTFWMCWADFKKNFSKLVVCHLYQDIKGTLYKSWRLESQWVGPTAGGSQNNATWPNNPQFCIINPNAEAVTVHISLSTQDNRWARDTNIPISYDILCIGFLVFWVQDPTTKVRKGAKAKLIAKSGEYINRREVGKELRLEPGQNYMVVPATFKPGECSRFSMTVFCPQQIKFAEVY